MLGAKGDNLIAFLLRGTKFMSVGEEEEERDKDKRMAETTGQIREQRRRTTDLPGST